MLISTQQPGIQYVMCILSYYELFETLNSHAYNPIPLVDPQILTVIQTFGGCKGSLDMIILC